MPRWLMQLAVEGHLGLEASVARLVFRHPRGLYEVHLENDQMDPGCEIPLLRAFLLFDNDSLESASDAGERFFQQFLDLLSLATGARFRIRSRVCLFDWTPEIEERYGYVYQEMSDPNFPQLILNERIVSTVESLCLVDLDQALVLSIHWFADAVSSNLREDQFQLFWFVLETLAEASKGRERVPDLCAKCREPLLCPKCKEAATHRPYRAQAVRQLFMRHVPDGADTACVRASAMRHALLHGGDSAAVEREHGTTLEQLVDLVGKVAWASMLTAVAKGVKERGGGDFSVLEPSTYLHRRLTARVGLSFRSPIGREIDFTDIPPVNIAASVHRDAGAEGAPSSGIEQAASSADGTRKE